MELLSLQFSFIDVKSFDYVGNRHYEYISTFCKDIRE